MPSADSGGSKEGMGGGASGPWDRGESVPAEPGAPAPQAPPPGSTPGSASSSAPSSAPSGSYTDSNGVDDDARHGSADAPESAGNSEILPTMNPEEAPPPVFSPAPSPTSAPIGDDTIENPTEQDQEDALIFTAKLYAIIEITGGLAEAIEMYGLDPMDNVPMYFEIPRGIADQAIEYLRGYENVKITIVDAEGDYAAIFYTPD